MVADRAGHRRRHWFGHLYGDWHGHRRPEVRHFLYPQRSSPRLSCASCGHARPTRRRACARSVASAGRNRVRVHCTVLCRACVDDSDRRKRLHLHLRHHGRVDRVDHWLGPHFGIRRQQHGGERRFRGAPGRYVRLVRLASGVALDLARVPALGPDRLARQCSLYARMALRIQHSSICGSHAV